VLGDGPGLELIKELLPLDRGENSRGMVVDEKDDGAVVFIKIRVVGAK